LRWEGGGKHVRTRNERKRHNEPNTAVDDGKGFGVYVGDQ
jgi:hypothetical protein